MQKKEIVVKTRNWATIIYPESAPENWLDILDNMHIPCLISPLHDKDINPYGEPKKAHYHIILLFDSVKSQNQVREIFSQIGGVGCEYVNSIRGYARYLIHLDNPEKYQYNIDDVKQKYGVDYNEIISLESDKMLVLDEILRYIEVNNVYSFYDLCKYAFLNEPTWKHAILNSLTLFIKEYLKSRKWTIEQQIQGSSKV